MSEDTPQIRDLRRLMTKAEPEGWLGKLKRTPEPDLVGFFKDMSETERRALAPELLKWRKDAVSFESDLDARLVWLGLFATATLAEMKKYSWWGLDERAFQILLDRKVPWFQEWVELALEQTDTGYGIGGLVGALVELVERGVIDLPEHEHFAIGVAFLSVGHWIGGTAKDLPPVDQTKPVLRKLEPAIWRQFEVEGGGEISLANFDKYYANKVGGKWSDTLAALSEQGLIDRQRLLDASLDALNRGFKQYRASWFSRFHEQLKPSLEERTARTTRYLDLLASPVAPTVSMALMALKKIQKAGTLEPKVLVQHIEPAIYAKAAKSAKDALQLLAGAMKSSPDLVPSVLVLAAASLEHPKSDVQQAGLALIETRSGELTPDARNAIAARLDILSPVLRDRASALVKFVADAPTADPTTGADLDDLIRQAGALPNDLRELAGVSLALNALENEAHDIPAAPFTGMDVPRLDPRQAVEPISSFEEFVDEALMAVEHSSDLDLVERVLAGAVRFAADRPANATVLLGPLERLLKRFRVQSYHGLEWLTPRGALQIVLCAMLGQASEPVFAEDEDPRAVMISRTEAMAVAILERKQCIQYSAPTHGGCWIDPRVLVERTRKAGGNEDLGLADQTLALLRMAPDHRAVALQAADGLDGEWASALRYALGDNEDIGSTLSLWIAAARARDPFGNDDRIVPLTGMSRHGEDLAPALSHAISWSKSRHDHEMCELKLFSGVADDPGTDFGKECWTWDRDDKQPDRSPRADACVPTYGLSNPRFLRKLDSYLYDDLGPASATWLLCIWPQHPEPVFALGAKASCMLDGVVGFEPATEPLAEGLTLIQDPDVPVGPMGRLMLARGLNAMDRAAAQATVDALITVIEDGRLDGERLGAAMHDLLMGGIVVAKRWQDRLRDVARTSPLTSQIIKRALERAIYPGSPKRPMRNMHAWLEVLLELCVASGEAIDDPLTRQGLKDHFTTGKAKKVAGNLLQLDQDTANRHRKTAALQALEQRITRAERWVSWAV